MNVSKIMQGQHSPEQISALWTAYHSSLSKGTGRGFLSTVIPLDKYNSLARKAKTYPSFLLPLRREVNSDQVESATDGDEAFEFYFMEWAFHPSPPLPSADPFSPPQPSPNPDISTILFTPLQEYKLRQTFATPQLVLTHYTDFVSSHGLVLLRGELTPSSQRTGEFLLSQQDAQLLAIGVQRFYLTGGESEGSLERSKLLQSFHESPSNFDWKKLLEHADPTRT
jgi:ATP synthase F1 complex assembly factor 1